MNTIETEIELAVAGYFNLSQKDIQKKSRKANLVYARDIAWYLLNNEGETYNHIGPRYNKSGSGVRKAINKIKPRLLIGPILKNQIATITAIIETKRVLINKERMGDLIEIITNQIIDVSNSLKRLQVEYKRLSEL